MKKNFCIVPWKDLYSTSVGTFRLCCLETGDVEQNQTPIHQDLDQHWNSEYMRQARLDFLTGKQHHACSHCYNDDANGRISLRQRKNFKYLGRREINDQDFEHVVSITDGLGRTSTDNIQGANLSVNNTCQLRCNHCSPTYSHNISKDYAKIGWDHGYKTRNTIYITDYLGTTKQSEFNDAFWPKIKDISHQFRVLHFTGGEPSISSGLIGYLEWLVESGFSKNIDLGFNTNAVKLSDRWFRAIKSFKSVKPRISIDAVGSVEHYIRYPSSWEKNQKTSSRWYKISM